MEEPGPIAGEENTAALSNTQQQGAPLNIDSKNCLNA